MKIKLEKFGKRYWRADFEELPGSPDVGEGTTKTEAIACLFIRNRFHIERLNAANPILTINGKVWRSGSNAKR